MFDLDALQDAALKQAAANTQMREIGKGVGGLGVLYPEMFEDMLDWSNSTENEHADTILYLIADCRAALARIALVEALHAPDMVMSSMCAECSDFGTDENPEWVGVEYPCRTLRALAEGDPDG